jgi:hypothetical protein
MEDAELTELGKDVATLKEAQRRTNGWQKDQDTTLVRLEGKVDGLRDFIDEKIELLRKEERGQKNQWTTWAFMLVIGLPGTLYAVVNLIRALAAK